MGGLLRGFALEFAVPRVQCIDAAASLGRIWNVFQRAAEKSINPIVWSDETDKAKPDDAGELEVTSDAQEQEADWESRQRTLRGSGDGLCYPTTK
jgi:hypothetical protein